MNTMKTSDQKRSIPDILNDQFSAKEMEEFAKEGSRTVCNQVVAMSDLAKALGVSERTLRRDLQNNNCSHLVFQVGKRKYILFEDFIKASMQYMKGLRLEISELKSQRK